MGCCRLNPQRVHIYEIDYQQHKQKKFPFYSDFSLTSTASTLSSSVNDKYLLDGYLNQNKLLSEDPNMRFTRFNQSAMKMLIRNYDSRNAFWHYLNHCNSLKISKSLWKNHTYRGASWSDMLDCFINLEDIKFLTNDDQIISRITALVWRYQTMYESVHITDSTAAAAYISGSEHSAMKRETEIRQKVVEFVLWECMGNLKHIEIANTSRDVLVGYLDTVQESILYCLAEYFEDFLKSDSYADWQINRFREEKMRCSNSKLNTNTTYTSLNTYDRLPSCSAKYPKILVVDDSAVVVKLIGLTLEKDGHVVHTASSGKMALSLSSTNQYDVILIDVNMPVYDGCETVQLLRHRELAQFEEEQEEEDDEDWEEDDYFNSSEVSSLSAHSWIPLEEQTFYKNYYKAYQRMAARELKTREEKEKQQKEAENAHEVDPAIDTCVDSSIKVDLGAFPSETATDIVVAFEHPASEQLGDTLDVQRPLDDNIVLHDTSPPENNDQEEAGKHMGGETGACSNVVMEVAPPTESEIIAPAAQKQPLRRQLVVGMSDSNDESTRRKALECGMDAFIFKPFSLEKFLQAMISLPVLRCQPPSTSQENEVEAPSSTFKTITSGIADV